MFSGMMLDEINMNIFTQSTKNPRRHIKSTCFPDSRMMQFNCIKDLCRTSNGKQQLPIQKGHCVLIIAFKLNYWENIFLVSYISKILRQIWRKRLMSSSMIKATLITHISLSPTLYLYPIYHKKNDSYHPWHQLDSGMINTNQDVMSTRYSKCFFSIYILEH